MSHSRAFSSVLAVLLVSIVMPGPSPAADWDLVWSDEFDGSTLDLSKWAPQIGTGCPDLCGWGNNELQYYRAENATVAGGLLTIEAKRQNYGGRAYTSARLRTLGLADWLYGRFEMRAKLPTGQGLWPAFWMLPSDNVYGGWARSGEIDIMEIIGSEPDKLHGTIHYGDGWPDNTSSGQSITLPAGDLNSNFHEFALEWEPTELRWYIDGQLYATQTWWYSIGNPFPAPFDERFHLLMNVAVGGNWPGDPDGSTVFPQQMVVDYVRVYRDLATCELAYDTMDHANPFSNGWFQFNGSVGGGGLGANTSDVAPGVGGSASIETGWGSGGALGFVGGFGRSRDLDLTPFTHFEFWINPDAGQAYSLEVNIQDDDNGDERMSVGADDEFQKVIQVGPSGSDVIAGGGWQKVSIPFTELYDDNSYYNGGNGVLDAVPTGSGGNGMMVSVAIAILNDNGADISFRTDQWTFTSRTSAIDGVVWNDSNGDGVQDPGEPGLAGVTVELLDDTSTVIASAATVADGRYAFDALLAGTFEVQVDEATLPTHFTPTFDPDGTATPDRFSIDVECDSSNPDGDFGYRNASTATPSSVVRQDRLYGASPNPFNARTVLQFELASGGIVELAIFDAQGRLIRVLESGEFPAGVNESIWDGTDSRGLIVASGVYYASLESSRGRSVTRMVLLK